MKPIQCEEAQKAKVPLEAWERGGASHEGRRELRKKKKGWLWECKYFSALVEPVCLLHTHRNWTHKEQWTEHKHTHSPARKNGDCKTGFIFTWRQHTKMDLLCVCFCVECVSVYKWGVFVFLRTFMGSSALDMGGCQSYNSSDEEDINALKANYNNISLFKV